MSDNSFHFDTHDRVSERFRDTLSRLARVDWVVPMLAFAGVATLAWIGFLLWAAFKLLGWSFS